MFYDVTKTWILTESFMAHNFWSKRDTDMRVSPSCSSRRDALNDLLFDLKRSIWNLTSGQGHVVTQGSRSGSWWVSLEAHWRHEHIGALYLAIASFYRELLPKKVLAYIASLWRHCDVTSSDVTTPKRVDITCDINLNISLALALCKPVYIAFIVKITKISIKSAGGCSIYDVITLEPEVTSLSFLHQKMRKEYTIHCAKFGGAARRRFPPTLEKPEGGCNNPFPSYAY